MTVVVGFLPTTPEVVAALADRVRESGVPLDLRQEPHTGGIADAVVLILPGVAWPTLILPGLARWC